MANPASREMSGGTNKYMLRWLHDDPSQSDDVGEASGEDDVGAGLAARLHRACLHVMRYIHRRECSKSSPQFGSTSLKNCLSKLFLWGDEFGVGDLDKALDQSDELRESVLEQLICVGGLLLREESMHSNDSHQVSQVIRQVNELRSTIEQARFVLPTKIDENLLPRKNLSMNSSTEVTRSGSIFASCLELIAPIGGSMDDECESGRDDYSDADSSDMCDDMDFAINRLIELRPSIEQNLIPKRDLAMNAAQPPSRLSCLSTPARVYVGHIREKFDQAPDQLVERLGEANWQRHLAVRRRMETENVRVGEKEAGSVVPPRSFHDSGYGTSVPTQAGYALSHTSFISSNHEEEGRSLRVPASPAEVGTGKSFRCLICGLILSNVKNRVDWKLHVFADLKPYMCTFTDCGVGPAQFSSRSAWAEHEFSKHRIEQWWQCPECGQRYVNPQDWEQHLQHDHQRRFSKSNLQVVLSTSLMTEKRAAECEECPLCRIVLEKPQRAFAKHVGQHMEQIALMVLPRDTEDDSNGDSTTTNEDVQNSQKASRSSVSAPCAEPPALDSKRIGPGSPASRRSPVPPPDPTTIFDEFFTRHAGSDHDESYYRTVKEGAQMEKNLQASREQLDEIEMGLVKEAFKLERVTETLPEGQRESLPPSPRGKSDEGGTEFVDVSQKRPSPPSHTEKDRDYSDLAESHMRRPGSSLFSLEDSAHQINHTSDTFADWLFEPETVKGFMAAPDNAGGRSENRQTLGSPTDCPEDHPAHEQNDSKRRSWPAENHKNHSGDSDDSALKLLRTVSPSQFPHPPPIESGKPLPPGGLDFHQWQPPDVHSKYKDKENQETSFDNNHVSQPAIKFQDRGKVELSAKPRCQRCRKLKKGCDRQRPCQRCKDADVGTNGCISEEEDGGRKGHSLEPQPMFERKDAVYWTQHFEGNRKVKRKRYVCCSEVREDGAVFYRLKLSVPVGNAASREEDFVTDWIPEGDLRKWKD